MNPSSHAFSGQASSGQHSATYLGKRQNSETSESEDANSEISRLNERNSQLKQQLSDSQEEVKRLTAVIEQHEIHKKAKQEEKAQTRYWTDDEHQRFLEALQTLGPKDVKAISNFVGTRSATQVRTHAQKYFIKLARIKKNAEEAVQAGAPGAAQEAWWLQGVDSSSSSSGSGKKADKSDGKRRNQGLPGGLEGMDSGSIQALADMVGSAPLGGSGGSGKRQRGEQGEGQSSSQSEPGSSASSDTPSRGGGGAKGSSGSHKAGAAHKGPLTHEKLGLKNLQEGPAGGREKGMNLTSSSNEESGVTDGSSTHGNGSNGSWNESGSNNSLNNSDGSNGSSNNSDSDKGASSNNSDGGSNNSDGGSNNSDGGSERDGEREGSSERDQAEERADAPEDPAHDAARRP